MQVVTADELQSILSGMANLSSIRVDLENRVLRMVESEEERAKGKFSELAVALANAWNRLNYIEEIMQEAESRLGEARHLLPAGKRPILEKQPAQTKYQIPTEAAWVSPDQKVREWLPNIVHVKFGEKSGE